MANPSFYQDEILPRLEAGGLLPELAPKARGHYWQLNCPACGEKEAFFYRGGARIFCNRRAKCGASTSLWDYVQAREKLPDNRAVLEYLAQGAGLALPGRGEAEHAAERAFEASPSRVRETVARLCAQGLWEETKGAKEARAYLASRGYSEEDVRRMGIGLFPAARKGLERAVSEEFPGAALPPSLERGAYGNSHPLVFPWRDAAGRIVAFVFRAVKAEVSPKYLFEEGLKKDVPFNLHAARGVQHLIVVEGLLDALLASARGMAGVIASGGAGLTAAQMETLAEGRRFGAPWRSLTLAYDADEAGVQGAARTLQRAGEMGLPLALFVAGNYAGHKDPDAWISQAGIDAFREAVANAQPAALWKLSQNLAQADTATARGAELALGAAVEQIAGEADGLALQQLSQEVRRIFDLPEAELEARIEAARSDARTRGAAMRWKALIPELQRRVRFDPAGISGWLEEMLARETPGMAPLPAPVTLSALIDKLVNEPPGLKTGWVELDRFLTIPRGALGVVAAKPRHGKTTFLLNLLSRFAQHYPGERFLFVTYEERAPKLALKLINLMADTVVDRTRWMQQQELLVAQLKKGGLSGAHAQAMVKLDALMQEGRVQLIDEPYTAEALADVVMGMHAKQPLGGVFIDYVQKIPLKAAGGKDQRYLYLKEVSQTLLQTAIAANVPVITGCQLNRETGVGIEGIGLDHVRESSDIAQDANWVLALWNQAAEEEDTRAETPLQLKLLKNRDGQSGKLLELNFHRPTLRVG